MASSFIVYAARAICWIRRDSTDELQFKTAPVVNFLGEDAEAFFLLDVAQLHETTDQRTTETGVRPNH